MSGETIYKSPNLLALEKLEGVMPHDNLDVSDDYYYERRERIRAGKPTWLLCDRMLDFAKEYEFYANGRCVGAIDYDFTFGCIAYTQNAILTQEPVQLAEAVALVEHEIDIDKLLK
jgi:hypothetical protein